MNDFIFLVKNKIIEIIFGMLYFPCNYSNKANYKAMKFSFFILSLTILSQSIFSQSSKQNKWSPNFGIMNWHEAKKKCESINMRLPTFDELKDAFLENEMKTWTKAKEEALWSSDSVNDGNSAKALLTREGYESTEWKVQPKESSLPNMPLPEEATSVRCIRSDFKRKERKSGVKWGNNLGAMQWEMAKKRCAELKMKLPTLKQFEAGMKAREFENQIEGSYWLSNLEKQPDGKKLPNAYFVHWTNNHSHSAEPSENYLVRCAK